jgi:hypothetical protein
MSKRKKSALERLFSFNQHRRRFGAKDLILSDLNFTVMKDTIIDSESQCYTHGSKNDLKHHLNDLRNEFHGATELEYYHAKLNVLLRRKFKTKETFQKFKKLWQAECRFLIKHLNTRWLISAADSFVDQDPDPLARSYAFTAISLVNTCKLYETERFASETNDVHYNSKRIEELQKKRIPLFDGTSAFTIGTDDTLRNMRWRFESLPKIMPTSLILKEIFDRLNQHETAYKRIKDKHIRKNTIWW